MDNSKFGKRSEKRRRSETLVEVVVQQDGAVCRSDGKVGKVEGKSDA
jgi:hypothetical protein